MLDETAKSITLASVCVCMCLCVHACAYVGMRTCMNVCTGGFFSKEGGKTLCCGKKKGLNHILQHVQPCTEPSPNVVKDKDLDHKGSPFYHESHCTVLRCDDHCTVKTAIP